MKQICALISLLLWLPFAVLAQSYPEPISDTLSDYAGLLDPDTAARVSATLKAARAETGVHIAVALIDSQADYGGTGRFADFATGWFNGWGVGDATRNDGILILVARADREMRIVLGDAYGPVWDGRAQRVIDTAMLPEFSNDNYAAGVEAGVISAVERLARPYAAAEPVTEDSGFPVQDLGAKIMGGLLTAILTIGGLAAVFHRKLGAAILRVRSCPNCGKRGLTREKEILAEPGEDSEGRGITHLRCRSCGNDRETAFVIPSLSAAKASRDRSGSDGFGGGHSSGGGASGKW